MPETSNYREELLARLRQATEDFAWAVRHVSLLDQGYSPSAQEWTIHEHTSHVRDMETEVLLPLLRWATVPDMLDPLDYNRREWREQRYDVTEPMASMLSDLVRIRDEELGILARLPESVWQGWRTDTRWGPLTCQWIAETMYRHTLDHLQQVMALRQDIHLAALEPRPLVVGGYIGGTNR